MKASIFASAIALSLAGSAAQAAVEDYFLRIPGITGDSTDDKHIGDITVTSFSAGISNDGNNSTGRCSEFRIVKPLDSTSSQIALDVATHQAFPSIQLIARTVGERPLILTFTLLNAYINSVRFAGDNTTSAALETLAIKPRTVKIQYQTQNADGSVGATMQTTIDCSNTI